MKSKPPARQRVPPGQALAKRLAILDLGIHPPFDPASWRFKVFGLVENPLELDWRAFCALPQTQLEADFHCVTGWTALDQRWAGVRPSVLLEKARPLPQARWVMQHGADGYSTNTSLDDLLDAKALLATQLNGQPLPLEHGGPLRGLVPHLYAWKSSKFLVGLELMDEDRLGYWEQRGYHRRGDPFLEERYSGR